MFLHVDVSKVWTCSVNDDRLWLSGTSFEKKELFGQLPLQVDGFKDIHESLEATTAQGEIETLTEGVQSRSCQEVSIYWLYQIYWLRLVLVA